MADPIQVLVWNEFRAEREDESARHVYPDGIHAAIAVHLNQLPGISAGTASLDEPGQGLSAEKLAGTDVLVWWGHRAHHEVSEAAVSDVEQRVHEGMGLLVLHSAHFAKVFTRLMGTSCKMSRWDEAGGEERVWTILPGHPVTEGVGKCFALPQTEMYCEPFDIPVPDATVFISRFEGGEVFRSGCAWRRGRGRVFYFRPGHESYPIYRDANVLRVITNAVRWLSASKEEGPT